MIRNFGELLVGAVAIVLTFCLFTVYETINAWFDCAALKQKIKRAKLKEELAEIEQGRIQKLIIVDGKETKEL